MSVCIEDDEIYLVRGDVGSQIKATLKRDDDDSPVNLIGATVRLKVSERGSKVILFTVTADVSSPTQLAAGVAIFTFSGPNLDRAAGQYSAEIEATFESGNIETVYELIKLTLRDDFE